MQQQLTFDFRKIRIVKNHWSEAWHVIDTAGFTVLSRVQPNFFYSPEAAYAWCEEHGLTGRLVDSSKV